MANDTTAPSVPTKMAGVAVSATAVRLTWAASTDPSSGSVQAPSAGSVQASGVIGYRIYRNGKVVGTTAAMSFRDAGLSAATASTYRVAAYDAAGNQSGQSSQITVSTLSASANHAPELLPVGPRSLPVGLPLQIKLEAADSDGDKLQHRASGR